MDYFDLAEEHGGMLAHAFRGTPTRFCVVSFDTDWLYPTRESRTIVQALNAAVAPASFVGLSSPFAYHALLLASPELRLSVDGFLREVLRPLDPNTTSYSLQHCSVLGGT